MISTLCVNFALKKSKIMANGTAPIYLRLTIDGTRIEFTTRRYISPARWNAAAQKMTGTNEEAWAFKQYLSSFEQNAYNAHRELIESKKQVTVQALKAVLLGTFESAEQKMLIPIFEEHNRHVATLVGQDYAKSTLERYKTSLKHTIEFMRWHYGVPDIDVKKIDHNFIATYEFYLRSEKKCCNNRTVKYLKNFRKIITICLNNSWIDKAPYAGHKSKLTEVIPAYVIKQELQAVKEKLFVSDRVSQVRDIFLFSCFTGLAYADVKKLNRSEISIGIDGEQWVYTARQKTDTSSRIPLLPIALEIMKRYEHHPQFVNEGRLLPVLSNQKMNAYLKEIADLLTPMSVF